MNTRQTTQTLSPPSATTTVAPAGGSASTTEGDPPTTGPDRTAVPEYHTRVLQSIRRIIRSADLYSKYISTRHGITVPQLVALLTVCEHGPLTVTRLGKLVHLSPSTLIGVVDRLEEKGLVVRERSGLDRRVVHLHATEKGRALASRAPSPLQQGLAQALESLPEEEQCLIATALEKVVELMETDAILDAASVPATGADHGMERHA